jgi:FtsP/CotA-like multicopper oxidase with cupredoxin domain
MEHAEPRRSRKLQWKWFLLPAAVVAALGLGVVAFLLRLYSGAVQSNVGDLAFSNEVSIPPLLEPTVAEGGRRIFELEFESGMTELIEGRETETWGLNGTYLGPTLRASRGDEVEVRVHNGVDETTTLHWHGMHLPAVMDGGPHQMIEPGETWSPDWEIDQPAATLWYHPHLHGRTADHVYRGAAGMFILDDDEAAAAGLPGDYGVDDIPVIVQDRQFSSDGSLDDSGRIFSNLGVLGDEILINGTHDPYFEATTTTVRLRVLNGSNARVYNIGFDDDRSYHLVGTDSGLLEQPYETTRVQLSPGERAEILVEVEPGERTVLRSHPPRLQALFFLERFYGGDDSFDLLELRAADELDDNGPVPEELVELDMPAEGEATVVREFRLSGTDINGRDMDMHRIDDEVEAGTTEIWEVSNNDGFPHSFHPHLVHFAVLDIDGDPPPPELQGWKDTVYVPPNSTVRIIARFDGETDAETPYMYHCHILRHEDQGMMGQFTLVDPD